MCICMYFTLIMIYDTAAACCILKNEKLCVSQRDAWSGRHERRANGISHDAWHGTHRRLRALLLLGSAVVCAPFSPFSPLVPLVCGEPAPFFTGPPTREP